MDDNGQASLILLTKGHPLAVDALRQMRAVIGAAIPVVSIKFGDITPQMIRLEKALREGGWIK